MPIATRFERLGHRDHLRFNRRRLAEAVQRIGDEPRFQLTHIGIQPADIVAEPFAVATRAIVVEPGQRRLAFDRLGQHFERVALSAGLAIVGQHLAQRRQLLVETGTRHRRHRMRNDRGIAATLRNARFTRIVHRIHVEMGNLTEQRIRPARLHRTELQPGHPFCRTVHSDVHERLRPEAARQPAIERQILMMRRVLLVEQQTHRITRHADARLHADVHIAKLQPAQIHSIFSSRGNFSRKAAPPRVDALALSQRGPRRIFLRGNAHTRQTAAHVVLRLLHIGRFIEHVHELLCVLRQRADLVAFLLQTPQHAQQTARHIQQCRGAFLPKARRIVIHHQRNFLLAIGRVAQLSPLERQVRQTRQTVRHSDELPVIDRTEHDRIDRTVHFGQRIQRRTLHRADAVLRPRFQILHVQRLRHDVGHVERTENFLCRSLVLASFGAPGGSAHQRKSNHADEHVDAFLHQPFPHDDMTLDAADENRQHVHAIRFQRTDRVIDIRALLHQMLAEEQQRRLRLCCLFR